MLAAAYKPRTILPILQPLFQKLRTIYWVLAINIFLGSDAVRSASWWNCGWFYRSEISVSATGSTTDYAVQLYLASTDFNDSYVFTSDGSDIRVVDSDDATELNFFLESWDAVSRTAVLNVSVPSLTSAGRNIYIYYGNSAGEAVSEVPPASNAQSTFVESGWRIHSRFTTIDPTNEAEARSVFGSIADGTGGYGCAVFDSINGRNNQNTFSGPNGNYGLLNEVYFEVDVPGFWSFRYGGDYGLGGGLYVNSEALDERWNEDLWWGRNFNNPDVLSGSILLDNGFHHIETIGFEACCDGPIHIQFKKPGSDQWQDMTSANLPLFGRSCPPGNITEVLVDRVTPTLFGGSVYLDNGVGGIAHDGVRDAGELGVQGISVTTTVVATGSTLVDESEEDGSWATCFLDEAGGSEITIDATFPADYLAVSESVSATNTSVALDHSIEFTAAPDTNYTDINFGVIERPELSADRSTTISAGTTEALSHEYRATTAADVSFQISQQEHELPWSYTYITFRDIDCDGEIEQPAIPLVSPIAVVAGDLVCLVIQVTAGADADSSTHLKLQIDATSVFSGTGLNDTVTNVDEITADQVGELILRKQVCNQSRFVCDPLSGNGFGHYNAGTPGETLLYRIVFSSINNDITNLTVFDSVPVFTTLTPMSINLVRTPADVTCTLVKPADQTVSDYRGNIELHCDGDVSPTDPGIIGFSVLID
ncbi:hypothetical protein AB833_04270 [Chromatiales bacterium (ex Bugula neritina AB1)]|nr:hypothetical protein AB833_04270 [Chromatiales bacterium (ex Bugula neritina AB1)]